MFYVSFSLADCDGKNKLGLLMIRSHL